ncbi:MAG: NAD(P)-dependent oxidoreductase, partial [Nanoarchaeota archaeon]
NGFIGSHLADKLSEKHEVVVFDALERENLNPGLNIKQIRGDITSPINAENIENIDGIIHLAAISRVSDAAREPEKAIQVNVLGTLNILELAKKLNSWVIIGSSVEPATNLYGLTKLFSELLAERYARDNNLKILALKFSSTYGSARDNKKKVLPKLIVQALNNQEITLDNGKRAFDFIFIDDLIKGICSAVNYIQNMNQAYDTFSLCTNQLTSLRELAETIIKAADSKSKLIIQEEKESPEDTKRLQDIEKTEQALNFKAETGIEEGIRRAVEDFKKNFSY